jgi:regulator of protease activity HflC (stomatin/prohibitin superfamily)
VGEVVSVHEPGLYFKWPIIETMTKHDVRTRTAQYDLDNPLFAASKDLQDVNVSTVVNYHVEPTSVENLYQQFKTVQNLEDSVVRPIIRDIVKAEASNFTAEELVTRRAEYNDAVNKSLTERLQEFKVVVERVNITNFKFSSSFTESIEAKVTAEQQALKAERDLERVEFEAQQRITQAEAEAEAIRIQAEAITQQGGDNYVELQAIEKWNGALPQQWVPGSAVPFLNI